LDEGDFEIVLVDQTEQHPPDVENELSNHDAAGRMRWLRGLAPSIPRAMNAGLLAARAPTVIFLDDDIIPVPGLVRSHVHARNGAGLVAGQVLQPGESSIELRPGDAFRFNSNTPAAIAEFMGGNFSVDRGVALRLGGFDENFVGAAYRFEAEFAHRFVLEHGPIRYEPKAVIHHLAVATGGTRTNGSHLRTTSPAHSVGAYYFLLRTRPPGWVTQLLWRPLRSIRTRHHLRHPWWIPGSLLAEARGLVLALRLSRSGPRLLADALTGEGRP
jgi:hypothetical protein